jgi:hypothetical protein
VRIFTLLLLITANTYAANSPALSLSINGAASRIPSGSPLILSASVTSSESVEQCAADTFVLTAMNPAGENIELPFMLRSSGRVELLGSQSSNAVWTIAPETAAALPLGRYEIHASCGNVSARPAMFEITAEPANDRLLLSRWEELQGHSDQALTVVDEQLAETPKSIPALLRKTTLLEAAERYPEALETIGLAIQAATANDAAAQPEYLLRRRRALTRRAWDQ